MTDDIIDKVWEKALTVDGVAPSILRRDACGAWIMRSEYGNESSPFGWVIDHIYPRSLGGDDRVENLRPMQWENNLSKNDDFPFYIAVVVADGNNNIRRERQLRIRPDLRDKLLSYYKNSDK